jgi:nicotinamidase-related amidase
MFLVVDVQNDFISGTLNISHCSARQNGAEVRLKVKRLRVLKNALVPGCASSQHCTAVLATFVCKTQKLLRVLNRKHLYF